MELSFLPVAFYTLGSVARVLSLYLSIVFASYFEVESFAS
jgi:hypothetical protein